jgi:hypothetical protein
MNGQAPPPKKTAPEIPDVLAPREVTRTYAGQPWRDVVTAAEEGRDGLRLATERDAHEPDYTALREGDSRTFGKIAGVLRQNWTNAPQETS